MQEESNTEEVTAGGNDGAATDAAPIVMSENARYLRLFHVVTAVWQATRGYWIALAVLPMGVVALAADSALFGEHWIGYVITFGFALLPGIAAVGVVTTVSTCRRIYMASKDIASSPIGCTVSPGEPTPVNRTDAQ